MDLRPTLYACVHDGQVAMRMRSPLTLPTPRREPRYSNVLRAGMTGNRLNPLQFEALSDVATGLPSAPSKGPVAGLLRTLLRAVVPWMVQKFPRAGQ